MQPANLSLNWQSLHIEIPINVVDSETINFPIPRPIPRNLGIEEYTMNIRKDEFSKDIEYMLPETLDGELSDIALDSLFGILSRHIQQFGRILPSDLDTYIGQNILLFSSIRKALTRETFSKKEREELFIKFHTIIVNKLPEESRKAFGNF